MWKSSVHVIVELNHFQILQLTVKFPTLDDWVMVTAIYGSPKWVLRKELWLKLGVIVQNIRMPWVLVGDFNALLNEDEKHGGSRRGKISCPFFQQYCFDFSLKDAGFQGPCHALHGTEAMCLKGWIRFSVIIFGIRWPQVWLFIICTR